MPVTPIGLPLGLPLAVGAGFDVTPLSTAPPSGVGSDGGDFAAKLSEAVASLEATQDEADGLAAAAATGELTDVHDYMIAATEASVATELTVAVRNKAVEAFNEVMRMQV